VALSLHLWPHADELIILSLAFQADQKVLVELISDYLPDLDEKLKKEEIGKWRRAEDLHWRLNFELRILL
jgi:hypothetical protein